MRIVEIEEFAKQKKREHRMKIDKMKDIAKQRIQDSHSKGSHKSLAEKYNYDERQCGK